MRIGFNSTDAIFKWFYHCSLEVYFREVLSLFPDSDYGVKLRQETHFKTYPKQRQGPVPWGLFPQSFNFVS